MSQKTQESKTHSLKKRLIEPFEIEYKPHKQKKKPYGQTWWRWIALVLMNLVIFGDYLTLEAPQPIETQIKATLQLNEQEYSLLYSVWALPSIFSPFFGGYLIDRLGVRPTLMLFSGIVALGQFVYTYGGYSLGFSWMVIGRAIHALGADSLNVAQIVITNKWFRGKEIGFATSINGFTCGAGAALNSFLLPILYHATQDLGVPMMFGAILCFVGFLSAIILAKWDKENEALEIAIDPEFLSKIEGAEKASLKDIKYFKPIVWLLVINFGVINGLAFTFNAFLNDFYHETYSFTNVEAGAIVSSNFLTIAISSVFFGKLIDIYGCRAIMVVFSSLLATAGFLYFLLVPSCFKCISTIIPQFLLGLQVGGSEVALLASLPLVLGEKYLGTGYGLFYVLENVIVIVLAPMAAFVKDMTASEDDSGYFGMIIFFFVFSCLIPITAVKLFYESKRNDEILDKEPKKKDVDDTAIDNEISF